MLRTPALHTENRAQVSQPVSFFERPARTDLDPAGFAERSFETVRQLRSAVWVFDIDAGRVVLANSAALNLWQAETEAHLRSRNLVDGMSATVAQRLRQYQQDFIERSAVFTENWTLYPKGEPTTVMVVFSGYPLPDGRMAMLCEALHEAEDTPENLRSTDALMHADVMVTLYEADGPPIYLNPAARMAIVPDVQCFRDIFVEPEVYDDLVLELTENGEKRVVARIHTSSGEAWHDLSVKHCNDAATGQPAILVTSFNVDDLKTARDAATYLAERDQLTDCYNRNYLNAHLDTLLRMQNAVGSGLLYFDLDRFKQINDNYGHDAGDTVLKTTAQRIQSKLGPGETLARLGGDEFVLLIENIGTIEALLARANALLESFSKPISCGVTRIQITASMGAVLVTEDIADWSEAMRRADIALYHSKQAGRDRCSVFNVDMGRAALERARLEVDLANALLRDEFELHYQPRVDVATRQVVAVEALVRWRHPQRGLLPPGQFIPICEETGMIEALGELIIKKVSAQIAEWQQTGLDIGVSINVSPRQFQSDTLMDVIEDMSRMPNFPRNRVELEITETVLIGDHDLIADRLKTIKDLGFEIAIDDFGTGYSNLAYISRFPLHCIKIDKSFVDQLPASGPIINLILTLAEQIGAVTVAEGVEHTDQLAFLEQSKCQQVQGYIFAKPMSAKDLVDAVSQIEGGAR